MTSIKLAGEAITQLSRSTWEEFRKQKRVTKYFERSDGDRNEGRAESNSGEYNLELAYCIQEKARKDVHAENDGEDDAGYHSEQHLNPLWNWSPLPQT
jgi:hypothetical protein